MTDRNMDPDTILMLQEIARVAAAKRTDVIVSTEGLLLRRRDGGKTMEQIVSWIELRNVTGGPVWFVKSNVDYMITEMGRAE